MNILWTTALSCNATGNCVSVALTEGGDVLVGDTKNPDKEPHTYTPDEWDAFLLGARSGTFDRSKLRRLIQA